MRLIAVDCFLPVFSNQTQIHSGNFFSSKTSKKPRNQHNRCEHHSLHAQQVSHLSHLLPIVFQNGESSKGLGNCDCAIGDPHITHSLVHALHESTEKSRS